jgi:hypothetical protein
MLEFCTQIPKQKLSPLYKKKTQKFNKIHTEKVFINATNRILIVNTFNVGHFTLDQLQEIFHNMYKFFFVEKIFLQKLEDLFHKLSKSQKYDRNKVRNF